MYNMFQPDKHWTSCPLIKVAMPLPITCLSCESHLRAMQTMHEYDGPEKYYSADQRIAED